MKNTTDKMMESLSQIQKIVDRNDAWMKATQNAARQIEMINNGMPKVEGAYAALNEIQKVLERQRVNIIGESLLNVEQLLPTVKMDTSLIIEAAAAIKTPEIEQLQRGLLQNESIVAIQNFSKCLSQTSTSAANVGLIKTSKLLQESISEWNGLKTLIRSINVPVAKELTKSEGIILDTERKEFQIYGDSEYNANSSEINSIIYSKKILHQIDEKELMKLMDLLSKTPEIALSNETGRKIFEIVQGWDEIHSFDKEKYFRAREIIEGQAPYLSNDYRMAPREYVHTGRYNHNLESHYYFADTAEGATSEVRKHKKGAIVQIAELIPNRGIRMIDLSEEKESSAVFKYLRFEYNENDKTNRAYLIPNFIASCCKGADIEAIKYWGGRDYNNYVSWDDSYFDISIV